MHGNCKGIAGLAIVCYQAAAHEKVIATSFKCMQVPTEALFEALPFSSHELCFHGCGLCGSGELLLLFFPKNGWTDELNLQLLDKPISMDKQHPEQNS